MQRSVPTRRTLALVGLLVVGVACSFAFHAALAGTEITYDATQVGSGEDPARVAAADSDVVALDRRLDGVPAEDRRPVRRAASDGTFEGNVTPDLDVALDDVEAAYVVYEGSYYRWNRTADAETTFLRIEMARTDAAAVLDDVAEPYGTAPPDVKTAVESGSVTADSVDRGVYRRGDAYYAVAPESGAAVATTLLGGFAGYLLTPVGRGYVAVALGLLAYRYRDPSADRVLTVRRAIAVAALAVPVALVGTALFESGSVSRFVRGPTSSLVVATGVVAGVLVHQRRWARLVGVTVGVVALVVGVNALALGPFGALVSVVSVLVGLAAGVVPLAYGVAFARAS
ncbi:hypothetical protein [Halorussus halobius]|uniref:hypothetical protein n=1 Tax=Halorussus halobius TaxID=1710537 RepID=UPI0010921ECC|nr:hypothetical protein [Halorussus halobius]